MAEQMKNLLKKTSAPEDLLEVDLKWMENVEPMNDFLKWIENCVSDRNCITPREITTHQTLSQHDKLLGHESLESTFQQEFSGNLSISSYHLEVKALENTLIDTQKRLGIICDAHKELVENNNTRNHRNALLSKLDKMLDEEAKRTRALIAGEYRKALGNLTASSTQLSNKLSSIANNGSPPGTIGFTNLDNFCGLVEDLKMYISLCTDHFEEEIEKEKDQEGALNHWAFDTPNLSRLFNDSVKAEITSVRLMADIEGLIAALGYLRNDASSSLELPRSALNEDIYSTIKSICHDKMVVAMRAKQLDHATHKRLRKERLKPKMEKAVELARRMKLIGDGIINIVKKERLWVLTCREMLDETVQVLEDEFEDIHKCQDNIQKSRTVNDLSVSNHSFMLPPALASSFIGSSSLNRRCVNNSVSSVSASPPVIEELTNSALSKFKNIEEQAKIALVGSKTLYNGLFRGPSATPQSISDYVLKVLHIKENMDKKDRKWSEINDLQAVASPAEPVQILLEKLCWAYLVDPEIFFLRVNRIEEELGKNVNQPSFCLTRDISKFDDSLME